MTTELTGAANLTQAYHDLTTGQQEPPKPWAHLSNVGIVSVSEIASLEIGGFTEQAGFDVLTESGTYRVMVTRVA